MHLTSDSENEIRKREKEWGCTILKGSMAREALEALAAAGCNSETLIWVLELLHIYSANGTTRTVERVIKNAARRAQDLASKLRRNERTLQGLDFQASIAMPMSKQLLGVANELEFFSAYTRFVWSNGVYGRRLGGFLYPLAYAAELIERKTKAPHYRELLDLLNAISLGRESSEESLRKKIWRFKKRNPEFWASKMQGGKLAWSIRSCIAEDRSFRTFLGPSSARRESSIN